MYDPWNIAASVILTIVIYIVLNAPRPVPTRLPPGPGSNTNPREALKQAAESKKGAWTVFNHWTRVYGPVFAFYLGRTPVIVLNRAYDAWDLLERRGDIYSSRPRLIMAHEILSGGMRGLSMPYGTHWRKWRKIQHAGMGSRAARAYREHQTLESTLVLRDLAKDPGSYAKSIQRFATSVVLSISYGRRAQSLESEVVQANYDALLDMITMRKIYLKDLAWLKYNVEQARLGDTLLNQQWPILLWLPRFLQWFRPPFDRTRARDTTLYLSLLRSARARAAVGEGKPCMAASAGETVQHEGLGLSETEVAYAVSAPFGAGIDTTASSVEYFLLAALRHPMATRKAQAEIDRAVGRARLPTFADADAGNLPYLTAFIKEVERWRPVVPLAVPHALTRDDVYAGYELPRGSTVFANIHAMTRDPKLFPKPEVFHPERFLPTFVPYAGDGGVGKEKNAMREYLDPHLKDFTLPFGFGRRMCPGMHVASQSMFILAARILWTFDILPHPDDAANPNILKRTSPLDDEISLGLVRAPAPFRFELRVRHPDALKMVEAEAAEAELRLMEWD